MMQEFVLHLVQNLTPFLEINPYKEALNTANLFCEELNSFAADTVKAETSISEQSSEGSCLCVHVLYDRNPAYFQIFQWLRAEHVHGV